MNANAGIKKGELTQSARENLVMKLNVCESLIARLESKGCTCSFSVADNRDRRGRLTMNIFLLMCFTVSVHRKYEVF